MKTKVSAKKIISGTLSATVLTVAVFFLQACAGKTQEYYTYVATNSSLAYEIEVTGTVHGADEKTYYAEVTAPVSKLDLKVGDTVKNGEKIVEYDTWDLQNAFLNAQLDVASAQNSADGQVKDSNKKAAIYNKASADVETYKILYALVRGDSDMLDINQYQENWDIAGVKKCMDASIADKSMKISQKQNEILNETDPEKIKKLTDDINDLQSSINGIQKDIANLPQAQKNPDEYRRYLADSNWLQDIKTNWAQSQTQANTYEGQILNSSQKDALYNSVEIAQLNADIASENLSIAENGISADMNGIVTEVNAKPGALVTKGSPVFSIESSDDVKVDVEISKYDIGRVAEGQRAIVSISGVSYEGEVYRINRFATGGTSDNAKINVSVRIKDPGERVYLGIQADVTIIADEKDNVLVIPRESYYSDDSGDYVYAITDNAVEKKYIGVGIVNDEKVEVTSGISSGCVVIIDAVTDEDIGKKAVSK